MDSLFDLLTYLLMSKGLIHKLKGQRFRLLNLDQQFVTITLATRWCISHLHKTYFEKSLGLNITSSL